MSEKKTKYPAEEFIQPFPRLYSENETVTITLERYHNLLKKSEELKQRNDKLIELIYSSVMGKNIPLPKKKVIDFLNTETYRAMYSLNKLYVLEDIEIVD